MVFEELAWKSRLKERKNDSTSKRNRWSEDFHAETTKRTLEECSKFHRFPIRRVIERVHFVQLRRLYRHRLREIIPLQRIVNQRCARFYKVSCKITRHSERWLIHGFVKAVIGAGNFTGNNFIKTSCTGKRVQLLSKIVSVKKKKKRKRI